MKLPALALLGALSASIVLPLGDLLPGNAVNYDLSQVRCYLEIDENVMATPVCTVPIIVNVGDEPPKV